MVSQKQFRVVSLFSGAMGLDLGLEQTGHFITLAAVERQRAYCETIRRNCSAGRLANADLRVYESDIKRLDPYQLMGELDLKPGELDLLVGGPPCQSFSTTGKRGTIQDPRGSLLWDFLRFISAFQPKFFLMENVRGLMSAAILHRPLKERPEQGGPPLQPDEQPGSVIQRFLLDLEGDYRLDIFEVNAVNYGAPQLRERVLFIGNRFNRLVDFPEPTHGTNEQTGQLSLFQMERDSILLLPFRTLGEAIADLHEEQPVVLDFSPRKKSFLAHVPPGGNWRSLPPDLAQESMGQAYYAKGGRSGWWRRLSFDLPSPTIVTMPNHAGTALCHPTKLRALTLRECARIQEFPDDWEFAGSVQEQYTQVGNAVPVRLGRVSGEVLASHLDAVYPLDLPFLGADYPAIRIVYIKSHIRTRHWYKNGQEVVWTDGEVNANAHYSPAKTKRRVTTVRG